MKVHMLHQWGNWHGIEEELFRAVRENYEYVPTRHMYDCQLYITWQDLMGAEAEGAVARRIPLMVVQHGAHAFTDYLPEVSKQPIADHYCCWGTGDASYLKMAGVPDFRIHVTGSPVINDIHDFTKRQARAYFFKYLKDKCGINDTGQKIIIYGPDHATSRADLNPKNHSIMQFLTDAMNNGSLENCILIVKIYKEAVLGYKGIMCKNPNNDPYDWLVEFGQYYHQVEAPWIETQEGPEYIQHGGLHSYLGHGDNPNILFTCGNRFPQHLLFAAGDLCIVPTIATFGIKAISADMPVIVPGRLRIKEDTHTFEVHGKRPYKLYTEDALEYGSIVHVPDMKDLIPIMRHSLKNPELLSVARMIYAARYAGPRDGAIRNIMNIIDKYKEKRDDLSSQALEIH